MLILSVGLGNRPVKSALSCAFPNTDHNSIFNNQNNGANWTGLQDLCVPPNTVLNKQHKKRGRQNGPS